MKLYFSETVTGLANGLRMGSGLTSTEVEPKKINNVIITVSARNGNFVEGWIERERTFVVQDRHFPLNTDAFRLVLPIDLEIPIGQTWAIGVRSGSTATDVFVTYEYEIVR